MKLVLDTKPSSGDRDEPAHRHKFPARYRRVIDEAAGDWAVFRRTRDASGHMDYLGGGQIERVKDDPETPGHAYAALPAFSAAGSLAIS